MRLVDKQILRELVGPFLFGVMAFSSVFFAGTYMLKLTGWLMNGQLTLGTACEIVLLLLPGIVVYTLPMATLLSVLIGIGRLSGDSEVVALFAGGVSLYRIVAPVFILGVVVSGSSILLNEIVAPKSFSRYQMLQAKIQQVALPTQQPFTVRDDDTNALIYVKGGMNPKTGVLRDVTVTKFVEGRPFMVVYAARAQWAGVRDPKQRYKWQFSDGWWQLVGTESPAMSTFSQSNTREEQIHKTPAEFSLYQVSYGKEADQLSFRDLTRLIGYVKANPDRPQEDIRKLEVNRWNKLALPLSSLIFAMLAAPLGVRPTRSGSSVGFGLSVLLIFLYWMVWNYTSKLAIQGSLTPFVGAFTANVVALATSVALLRKAAK